MFDVLLDEPARFYGSRVVWFGLLGGFQAPGFQLRAFGQSLDMSAAGPMSCQTHFCNQRRPSAIDFGGSAPSADEPFCPSLSRTVSCAQHTW